MGKFLFIYGYLLSKVGKYYGISQTSMLKKTGNYLPAVDFQAQFFIFKATCL